MKMAFWAIVGIVLGIVAVVVIRELAIVNEALAVVVGVICGAMAAVPTSLLLLAVLTKSERRRYEEEERRHSSPGRYPPVVVSQSGGAASGSIVVSRNGTRTEVDTRQDALAYLSRPLLRDRND